MDQQQIAGRVREDRLSELGDGVLGHILSFLGTKEAARAAVLSSQWRDILASVHTVSLEQPEEPVPDYDNYDGLDRVYGRRQHVENKPTPFTAMVTVALFARIRQPTLVAPSVPLRTLRVAMENYRGGDAFTVDQWLAYALRLAAPDLEIELILGQVPVCKRPDPDPFGATDAISSRCDDPSAGEQLPESKDIGTNTDDEDIVDTDSDDEDVASSNEKKASGSPSSNLSSPQNPQYTVLSELFSFAALRSLRVGNCRLCPPAAIGLPALEALSLTHVPDAEEHVQRLISACTRLADLTLEACSTVTTLSLLHNTRIRRLVLRCCHKLATVTAHASELQSFEYRDAVPNDSFLTVPGGGSGFPSVTSCKMSVCTVCLLEEATSEEQLTMLGSFLRPFASTKHLHLCAARMGSCFATLESFPALRHLQLNGRVTDGDGDEVAAATSTILQRAPNLEVLTLFFETGPHELETRINGVHYCSHLKRGELLDAHHLHYSKYNTLDLVGIPIPRCLGSSVRKINLMHYQGDRAQRAFVRYLLRNALVLDKLHCELEEGPLWIQTELMREMEGWVVNETATKVFH